jgi:hypothetical protein
MVSASSTHYDFLLTQLRIENRHFYNFNVAANTELPKIIVAPAETPTIASRDQNVILGCSDVFDLNYR